jgi:hypothetical protein
MPEVNQLGDGFADGKCATPPGVFNPGLRAQNLFEVGLAPGRGMKVNWAMFNKAELRVVGRYGDLDCKVRNGDAIGERYGKIYSTPVGSTG